MYALTKTGAGTLTLSNIANTFGGGLVINNGTVADASASGTGTFGTGYVTFGTSNTPTLSLGSHNVTVAGLIGSGSNGIVTGGVAGSPVITLDGVSTQTFGGVISNGAATSVGLTLSLNNPTEAQILTGVNTYSGATTITAGTLQLGNGTAGNDGTIASTSGITDNGTLIYNRFGALSTDRVISGSGAVTISGPGSQTFTAANTYTGVTTINNGATLQLGNGTTGNDGTIASTSGITDNGTLIYNRFGALSSDRVISGTGGVTISGPGSQTLTGSNTYGGTTRVTNGTLVVTGSLNSSGSVIVGNLSTPSLTPTFSGSGTVGAVTLLNANGGVGSAGQLTPSATTLTLGSLNAQSGSTINLGTISPTLPAFNVSGAVNLLSDGGSTPINLTGTFGTLATGSYPLFNYGSLTVNGTATGTLTPDFSTLTVASGDSYSITDASNLVSLNIISAGPVTLTYLNQNGQFDTNSTPSFNGSSGPTTFQAGNNVLFDDSFSGPYTVPVSGAVSPGSTTFNNSGGNYVVSGVTSTSGITGSGSLTVNAGATKSVTLFTSNNYSGGTFVNTGTLILASANALPTNSALNISGGAIVQVANHTTNANFVPTVSVLSNNGTIDLTNNALVIHNLNTSSGNVNGTTAAAVIFTQIQNAYNNGAWNGTNASSGVITSTQAANDSTHLTAVGYVTGYTGSFENVSGGVTASDVLVKYTYYGDATLDGTVDGSDYSRIDNGYLAGASGWFNGDFNYDGHIDGSDYTLIDNAYNTQGANIASEIANPSAVATAQIAGSGAGTSAVPEPTTLGLLGLGAIGLLGRRRRKSSLKA